MTSVILNIALAILVGLPAAVFDMRDGVAVFIDLLKEYNIHVA